MSLHARLAERAVQPVGCRAVTTPAQWDETSVPDQSGTVALVTGATGGIGREVARALAAAGATVLLGARSQARAAAARSFVRAHAPTARVEVLRLDLADLASAEEAARRVTDGWGRLDVLVNNAGVMATPFRTTADGFELQFGTNHLGHFALTGRVLDALLAADAPRVVTVSSSAHRAGVGAVGGTGGAGRYRPMRAYAESKLANLLFTQELARRARAAEVPLVPVAAHPGFAATDLQAAGPRMAGARLRARLAGAFSGLIGQSARSGAWPVLYAATMPDVTPGDYIGAAGPFELWGPPAPVGMSWRARDPYLASWLWEHSEACTGVRYTALPPAAHG